MALRVDGRITDSDIADAFNTTVIDTILAGAYHADNIPMDGSYQCIPSNRLGTLSSVQRAQNLGPAETVVNAQNLYNELVRLTTLMTRVGTFTWIRTYNTDGVISITGQKSGKALFNTSAVMSLATVSGSHNVKAENIISVVGLNTLLSNLLTAWQNSPHPSSDERLDLCHSRCHSDCYSDCNCNSSCYK